MSLKQKLADFKVLLATERRYQWAVGIIGAMILFLIFTPGTKHKVPLKASQILAKPEGNLANPNASFEDFVTTFSQKLNRTSEDVDKLRGTLVEQQKTATDQNEQLSEILRGMLNRIDTLDKSSGQGLTVNNITPPAPGINAGPNDSGPASIGDSEPDQLDTFGDISGPQVAPPPPPPIGREAVISAGDSVRVKLLAGVSASTNGTPYPVVFKLVSDVYGPDGSALPLGEARVIAAAQGSLVDQRALFRLTTISMRFPDGHRKDIPVDGWVVGEDGIRGMEGILIDPLGKVLAGAAIAGTIEGVGEGLSSSQTSLEQNNNGGWTSSVMTGDLAEFSAGKGLSKATGMWGRIVEERLRQYTPHVLVYSGREATAVFSQRVAISGLYDTLSANEDAYGTID